MSTTEDQMRFWIEIDTQPIDNFVVPLGVASGWIARTIERDKRVVSAHVAGGDIDRSLGIRATVKGTDALNALWTTVSLVESAATAHNIGAIGVQRLRSVPEADIRQARPSSAGPALRRGSVDASVVTRYAKFARRNVARRSAGWALAPVSADAAGDIRAMSERVARSLRAHGADDVARSIERWLAPGIETTAALRGIRHAMNGVQDLSHHMPVGGQLIEHEADAVLRAIAASASSAQ